MKFKTAGLKLASLALAGLLLAGTAARADSVVNRGNGAEPETLDPQKLTGVPEANIAYDLYEGLATLDDHGNPTGGVAKSWGVSDDGKVYTFHLRDDAVVERRSDHGRRRRLFAARVVARTRRLRYIYARSQRR